MNNNQSFTIIEENDEKVELFLSCRKLKNMEFFSLTDPMIKVYIDRNGEYCFLDQTEVIWNDLNPNFTKSFVLDYLFEVKQKLKFEILQYNGPNKTELCGVVETTLGEIVGSKQMTYIADIKHKNKSHGKLVIKAEKVQQNLSIAKFQVSAKKLLNTRSILHKCFGKKSNPILKLSRAAGDSGFVAVYTSEKINNSLNPKWQPFDIKVRKLCNGDYFRPIKAQIYSRVTYTETLIGECEFTLQELANQEKREFTLKNPKQSKPVGTLLFSNFKLEEKPSFLDYIRGGTQLSVIVAIDFTGSNGDPMSPDSLHALKFDGSLNEYQRAIKGVCEILLNYDSDKRVPMYGFGGRPKFPNMNSTMVSHCFPLTGNPENPWAYGLDGIMATYQNALKNVELSGPTLFAPILQEAMKVALHSKSQGSQEYNILLILTDGEIHDMEQSINCLGAYSKKTH